MSVEEALDKWFAIKERGSSIRTECLAGLTSFMAMCYLIFVIPDMLADAGMPREAAVASTIWITVFATLLMGLWAKFPVGVAPGLGISAYFAYYVCGPAGYTWQEGLGAVFFSGLIFLALTVTKIRQMLIDAVPMDMKYSIVAGIGAFIAFIGMKNCGIIVASPSTFVALGNLRSPQTLLAIAGIFIIAILLARGFKSAMLIGIFAVTLIGMISGVSALPQSIIFSPEALFPSQLFLQLDFPGLLTHGLFTIVFTLTMVDLFDNMGVLIGLSQKAGFMEKDGHIKNLDKALVTDSIATMASGVLGATTATSYLESAAGVASGGKTGLTALVIAGLFSLSLFCVPLIAVVPAYATAPVLIVVGALMMQEVTNIKFSDLTIAVPAFLTIISMPLTFNIATGFGFGFISYVLMKAGTGKFREVNFLMVIIAVCFAVSFVLR